MAETDSTREAIARRLRAAREQAGLSQGQVARLLDYQRPTISEIEAGRRKVSAEELARFADLYKVSVSWLTLSKSEIPEPNVELAARELAKLKKEDLDRILQLLRTLRKASDEETAAEWVGIALAAGLGGEDEARARYQKILRDGCELDKVLPAPAPADGPPVGHGLGRALSPDGGAQ